MPGPNLSEFQRKLGYFYKDLSLLRMALTHPSVAHEQGPGVTVYHNQRLEFLGDAVLQLVLTRELYLKFPGFGEGPLTKARAQLVNRRMLAEHGKRLEVGQYLQLSKGEEISGGRERQSSLADAYEAVVGSLFLDSDYDTARTFILREFQDVFGEIHGLPTIDNPKGELQELLQAATNEAPQYKLESMTGPDHDRVFICAVQHRGVELGRGSGKNKKEAESQAALMALVKL
ncbi:MAG TPA: ribonuclease III, partial [Verrucomicrobiae bacterium]|nr:ribonuclease III [Verrucomicrobiae bacterium]